MNVPLLDLKAQYASLRGEIVPAVEEVLESQAFINGPQVRQLEEEVARYSACAAAVGVSSGTDALLCSLMALEIGPGDEVITTPYTFFATAGSITRVGARPVFVDIDPVTFNIDASQVDDAVSEQTRAILPVHLFGQTAEMDPLLEIAEERELVVIEDAAQAIGATYKQRKAGSMGSLGCFSFFPSKNLGGAGDGGMIVTRDGALAERLACLRNHGAQPKYFHERIGGNFRLDTIQAAYLLVKLRHLEEWSERRRANAALYDELLASVQEVTTPGVLAHNRSIYNQYVIRAADRDGLRAHLLEHGVGVAIYYPMSLHQQRCFAELGHQKGDFPEAERAAADSLALPVYPELTEEQIRYVAGSIRDYFMRGAR
jgi:dTDP-4-amino-4,6-dideoxygalactose transaminase